MFVSKASRRQAGDTIIEVLVAIGVVSLVLVGAYSSVNHNTLSSQDAQEHAQALKLVQTQVEFLHAAGTGPTSGGQCFSSAGASVSGTGCVVSSSGTAGCTTDPCFHISVTPPSATSAYTVNVHWATLLNASGADVTVYYRPEVAS